MIESINASRSRLTRGSSRLSSTAPPFLTSRLTDDEQNLRARDMSCNPSIRAAVGT